jgi:hypothetical protein
MASKNRTQLKNQSDNTFQDAPPANITPPNHRTFNDDFIDSAANLKSTNIFEDENTFEQTAFFDNPGGTAIEVSDGDVNIFGSGNLTNQNGNITATNGEVSGATGIFDVLKHKIDPNPYDIPVSQEIDLTNLDGNIITIANSANRLLSAFTGGIPGIIFYATFSNYTEINPNGAYLPLVMNIGDVAIFQFTQPDEVKCLGIRRADAQEYFVLADLSAYTNLLTNELFQRGAEYVVQNAYEYPTDKFWEVKVKAVTNAAIEQTAYIRSNGSWIPVLIENVNLSSGSLPIRGATNFEDLRTLADVYLNDTEPQWKFGASVFVDDVADLTTNGSFSTRMFIDETNNPVKLNILNIKQSAKSFFGRIEYSTIDATDKFFAHHGRYFNSWGNNAAYEQGFTALNLQTFNQIQGNDIGNIAINDAFYSVVNDLVTINASVTFDAKFNLGVAGQECFLYFPLPFLNYSELGCGHGALRFEAIGNHENIGAIVAPIDGEWCLVSAKWNNSINTETTITISFSFTYLTHN